MARSRVIRFLAWGRVKESCSSDARVPDAIHDDRLILSGPWGHSHADYDQRVVRVAAKLEVCIRGNLERRAFGQVDYLRACALSCPHLTDPR